MYAETSGSETEATSESSESSHCVGVWGFSFNHNISSLLPSTPFHELGSNLPLPVLPKGLWSANHSTTTQPASAMISARHALSETTRQCAQRGSGFGTSAIYQSAHLTKFYSILHAGDSGEDSYTKDS